METYVLLLVAGVLVIAVVPDVRRALVRGLHTGFGIRDAITARPEPAPITPSAADRPELPPTAPARRNYFPIGLLLGTAIPFVLWNASIYTLLAVDYKPGPLAVIFIFTPILLSIAALHRLHTHQNSTQAPGETPGTLTDGYGGIAAGTGIALVATLMLAVATGHQ